MSFSINTNIASLQAESNLRTSSDFQAKTINRVTSGLRIVSSGDDAAGLAIANGFRSDQAVLTQGIRNANDGLSTLQTIDGGMNNISQLLDRARTLASQSASGTFSGDRTVLNSEFQSVMSEIDRQSQAIGLDQGGQFAKSLAVFIGGGKTNNGITATTNGSVSVDLSKATVDTKSLGMTGYSAGYQKAVGGTDANFYDLGSGSKKTSVAQILADGTNAAALVAAKNTITYTLSGPGYSGVTVSVNLSGVNDTASLATAINAGIASAATGNAQLKGANVSAVIHTGTDGAQQLQFTSTNSAFTVSAGADIVANAFLGNFAGGTVAGSNDSTNATGVATAAQEVFTAQGTQQVSSAFTKMLGGGTPDKQTITFAADSGSGLQTVKVDLTAGAASPANDLDIAGAVAAINTALQQTNQATLQGIVATANGAGTAIVFSSGGSTKFSVSFGVETGTALPGATGFATDANKVKNSQQAGLSSTGDISTQAGAQSAVSALATAVSSLGSAQAVVGKGQNNINYAISLAQSQSTNLAAAESRIRDADLASEAANLTKAQILVQAGTAALAQANSAPQAILTLLRG